MSNTLKIQIPEGFEIDSFEASTGEIKLKPIPLSIRERLQTMDDVYAYHGITKEAFDKKWNGFASHEIGDAYEKLIVAAYNEGKLPDFGDGTIKRYPIFTMSSPSGARFAFLVGDYWRTNSRVGSRLVFHGPESYENMMDAVAKFLPQYEQSRTS